MEAGGGDWRTQLPPENRQKMIRNIMGKLMKHVPAGESKLLEIKSIATTFEEKVYRAATSRDDYIRRIYVKMKNYPSNPSPSTASNGENPSVSATQRIQSHKLEQSVAMPLANQSEILQTLSSQNILNNNVSRELQKSSSVLPTMPHDMGVSQTPNGVDQNPNSQNISFCSQNTVRDSKGQGILSNIIPDSLRPLPGKQHIQEANTQQNQQQSQGQQKQLLQQVPHKQKCQQENSLCPLPNHIMQQQQQPNPFQTTQLQSPRQSVMKIAWPSSIQQSAQPAHQQLPQSVPMQQQQPQKASVTYQPQTSMLQQQVLPSQHQQLMGKQLNPTNIEQIHLAENRNCSPNLQQEQRMMLSQQNMLSNLQQKQQQPLALDHQNNLTYARQKQLGKKSNVAIIEQRQTVVGAGSCNSNQQSNWRSAEQQTQQTVSAALPSQELQSQLQQQLLSQNQSQKGNLQQIANPSQPNMQQGLKTSAVVDVSSGMDLEIIPDWQSEAYQKVTRMKEMYFSTLREILKIIFYRIRQISLAHPQHGSLLDEQKNDYIKKLKHSGGLVEQMLKVMSIPKRSITVDFKERLDGYEKQIIDFINMNKCKKTVASPKQGQEVPVPTMNSLQQSFQPHSQSPQMLPHSGQVTSNLQPMNVQTSGATMQQNVVAIIPHGALLSSEVSPQQNMVRSQHPGTKLNREHGKLVKSLPQVDMGCRQDLTAKQPINMNLTQSNIKLLQSNSEVLQHAHLKQQKEEQIMTQQQKRPFGQLQKQSQQYMCSKPHDISQQAKCVKSEFLMEYNQINQHYVYKQFPNSANYQTASPRNPQRSPVIVQQNKCSSLPNIDPPQSLNSSYAVPSSSSSTPLSPTSMPEDSQKHRCGISSLSNGGNIEHEHTTAGVGQDASPLISTPGMLASPLHVEPYNPGGDLGNVTLVTGKSSEVEQPLERLINLVKALSPKVLSASVSDIASVVNLFDKMAGVEPGNGSKSAVGDDLAVMTKCHLQAWKWNIKSQGGSTGTKRMRPYAGSISLDGRLDDRFEHSDFEASDLDSTIASRVKRPRIELLQAKDALLKEIREINQRLIGTMIHISDDNADSTAEASVPESSEGTIIECSFNALACSSSLTSHHASLPMSPILPLRLLIPANYPKISPIFLDQLPVQVSEESMDISLKAKSKLSISLRSIMEPITLGEIARTWDICARAVFCEYAQQNGGGNFSSQYGTWENCLSAA